MTEPGKAKTRSERSLPAQHFVCGLDNVVIRMVAAIDDETRSVTGHPEVDDNVLVLLV